MDSRSYRGIDNGANKTVFVSRNSNDRLNFIACKDDGTTAPMNPKGLDIVMATAMFNHPQPHRLPVLNEDNNLPPTAEDISQMLTMSAAYEGGLNELTNHLKRCNLQFVSHRWAAAKILEEANEFASEGLAKKQCHKGFNADEPWFDSWSEILSLDDARQIVEKDPRRAHELHRADGTTFAQAFLQHPAPLGPIQPTLVQFAPCLLDRPWWQSVASLFAACLSTLRAWR